MQMFVCVCMCSYECSSSAFTDKWRNGTSVEMKQLTKCLIKTLDELKRLIPDLYDSLTLSRHRKCLSTQRHIQRLLEV